MSDRGSVRDTGRSDDLDSEGRGELCEAVDIGWLCRWGRDLEARRTLPQRAREALEPCGLGDE